MPFLVYLINDIYNDIYKILLYQYKPCFLKKILKFKSFLISYIESKKKIMMKKSHNQTQLKYQYNLNPLYLIF